MVDEQDPHEAMGWLRAIAIAVVVAAVGIGVLVYGTNTVLTKVHNVRRSALVGIVTPLFFLVLIGFGATLRWLQRRNLI